jgi:hypothetical protein
MKSSPIIVLFGELPPLRRGPHSHLNSCAHLCMRLALFGSNQARRVDSDLSKKRYAVRIMELHTPEPSRGSPKTLRIQDNSPKPSRLHRAAVEAQSHREYR